ncbi:MAG TPA: diaminopimelate decarboxylase [Chthoniobacteraceae bacterium]|nr:diaminopimelate decarboxylase [Chthoniobacteraceae bacterium]
MHLFEYRKGHLFCEDVNLESLAKEAGTPAYVYSANTILNHYRKLDAALGDLDHLICYAMKANSNIAILDLLAKENCGFDIVSSGELYRVERAGGKPEQCTFAGVGKTENEIKFALLKGILCFNVESESELAYINHIAGTLNRRAPVALRVNPDVEAGTHKYISTGRSENKFGIGYDRIADVYAAASKMPHIRIRGVQMHIGSQITSPRPFSEAVAKMAPMVAMLQDKYGIEFFSFGGGIGIVYNPALESGGEEWWKQQAGSEKPGALTIQDYANAVVPTLKKLGLKIIVEPGRYMVGNAGVLLSKVLYVKKSPSKKFVIVDAGMNDLIRPALYEGYHEVVPLRQPASKKTEVVDIVGPVCESGDFFAQEREVPPLEEGDTIALMSAGAYGFAMASNYNSRPLPVEILVNGKQADVIRERQLHSDLIRGESIPGAEG